MAKKDKRKYMEFGIKFNAKTDYSKKKTKLKDNHERVFHMT